MQRIVYVVLRRPICAGVREGKMMPLPICNEFFSEPVVPAGVTSGRGGIGFLNVVPNFNCARGSLIHAPGHPQTNQRCSLHANNPATTFFIFTPRLLNKHFL